MIMKKKLQRDRLALMIQVAKRQSNLGVLYKSQEKKVQAYATLTQAMNNHQGYECHKDRDPNYRDEVAEGTMHIMHTMVKELHAFENAGPNTDVHVKLQRLEGSMIQAIDTH
jgi:hypothetical protein